MCGSMQQGGEMLLWSIHKMVEGDFRSFYGITSRHKTPENFPCSFLTRKWTINAAGIFPARHANCAETLEGARAFVPFGKVKSDRLPDDNATVVETWT